MLNMENRSAACASLALIFLIPCCFAQQEPAADLSKPLAPTESASVAGRTLSVNGQPLRKTQLTLSPADARSGEAAKPYAMVSDAAGNFLFESVEPGRYMLRAEHPGYVGQFYGAKKPTSGGAQLAVTPGQNLKGVVLELTPQSAISGRVVDEDGDPVGQTQIQLLQRAYYEGRWRYRVIAGTGSQDTGEFKLPNIPSGQYYVCATVPQVVSSAFRSAARDAKPSNARKEAYAPTCYPPSIYGPGPIPMELVPGHNLSGIEIRVRKAAVVEIRGRTSGEVPGLSPAPVFVTLWPAESDASMAGTFAVGGSPVDQNGNFQLINIHPGSYRLIAMAIDSMKTLGSVEVNVGNENLDGVTIPLLAPFELKGKVKLEGSVIQNLQISMLGDAGVFIHEEAKPAADGTFTFKKISGDKYRLTVRGMPARAYLQSVRLGTQEMTPDSIDLRQGASGEIEIILKMGAGELGGTVLDDKGQPVIDAAVTLVPDSGRSDLFERSTTNHDGHFEFRNLTPGKYRVYAWEDLKEGSGVPPEVLSAYEGKSVRINLGENAHERTVLTVISAPAGSANGRQ